jgi:cathepsin B
MGFIPNPESAKTRPVKKYDQTNSKDLPTNFDSATQWPACATIATIYDQARCGSCWAFGCVEAVSDRFCIHGNNQNTPLSFEDEVCCGPDYGCEGGDAGDAWDYVQQSGLVTAACDPYTIPTCNVTQEPCLNFLPTPPCEQQCSDSETWSKSKHFLSNSYGVNSDQNSIMQEIYTNGPVEACFSVYQDFLQYKQGVYQYDGSSEFLGGHCIKIRGWGVENGTPYWLCNNSWTTYWGDQGMFKILRGQDECGIEDDVVAGMPNTSR